MRRLLLLVSALVLVDTLLYAALTPLLPHFAHQLGLSKGAAGALVAAYAAGALVGALPGGLAAARFGVRPGVLAGLSLMVASSLGFAFADSYATLFAARLIQGFGSAFTWAAAFSWLIAAAPRERRGELLGTALGAAVFGALLGPVVGAAAAVLGRAPVFTAVGALGIGLAVWTLRVAGVPTERPSPATLARAFRNGRFLAGLALMLLPSILFGLLSVLGPLHLSAAGLGAAAIGAVWLVSAAFEVALAPLVGRLIDRRGLVLPTRVGLAAGAAFTLLLAFASRPLAYVPLVLLASIAYGILYMPGIALIADGADETGLAQGLASGMMNAAWAVGAVVGPAAGGAVAGATGDLVPFLLAAGLCGAGLLAARSQRGDARVLVDGAAVGRESPGA